MQSQGGQAMLSIRIEAVENDTGLPVIVTNVSVYSDLTFKAHNRGVLVPYKLTAGITSITKLSTVTETLNILARLKSLSASPDDETSSSQYAGQVGKTSRQ